MTMMAQITKTKGKITDFLFWLGMVILIGSAIWIVVAFNKQRDIDRAKWAETACPSLLSIARTSRDSLIIMKAEPACNQFVMDNLK